ncbi:hypothetical protein AB0K51_34725 [Kitasatospora sp. NPDC049285]|uniref:hypothetical protein n=1 Tax=Kitasatospora sp. NPDC049285 TaxID=3157096 RepID=UPI003417AF48
MGDVWVVPTVGGGREVVVAEQVGLRADGKPVVVVGGDSKWRRFTDSGDSRHTAVQEDVAGYRLTADGTIEGDLPEGFESADTAAGLTPLEGAAKFGDPVPFSPGTGHQGRDQFAVPGSEVRTVDGTEGAIAHTGWSAAVPGDRSLLGEEHLPTGEGAEAFVWVPYGVGAQVDEVFYNGLTPQLRPTYADPKRGYVPLHEVLSAPGGVERAKSMWVVGTLDEDYRPAGKGGWTRFRVLAKDGVTIAAAQQDGLAYGANTVAFFGGVRPELVIGAEATAPGRPGKLQRAIDNMDHDPDVRPGGPAEATGGPADGGPHVGQPSVGPLELRSPEVYEQLTEEIFERAEDRHPLPYDFVRPPGAPRLPARFGLEVEFNHQGTDGEIDQVRQDLAARLHAQGLSVAGVHAPHTGRTEGYGSDLSSGRVELDGSVAGEYVSAKLDPERPETWQAVVDVMRAIREAGGYPGDAGAHIHFSLDYHDRPELTVPRLTTLVNLVKSFEDVLYQLGQNPHSPQHRGTEYAAPLDVVPSLGYTRRAHGLPESGPSGRELGPFLRELSESREVAVNFSHVHGEDDDHLEVRLADGNLDPAVTQALVELWGAIIVYAKHHPGEHFGAHVELPLGTAAAQHRPEADVRELPEGMRLTRHRFEDSAHFARLVDLVFTDPAAKKRALTLWLLTQPQHNVAEADEEPPPVDWEEGWLPVNSTLTMPPSDWTSLLEDH